ncbi:MAG: Mur ligase [Planctomycetes bacterium]|nr:Mur ligase [Planctomycetota bacterium]MCC7172047.1 Mur ligase [Planctomycetota bacterium]
MLDLHRLVDDPARRLHFVGVAGTGMSALAQVRAMGGGRVSGSDRSLDRKEAAEEAAFLRAAGVELLPQDGAGVVGADLVIASTAVEARIADLLRAVDLGIPVLHRADLLAHHVAGDSVGIAGTSGKSTVTAMVFEILRAAGRDPSLATGGRLLRLMDEGLLGNAWCGRGPFVFEADESDGSLVKHGPRHGVVLNLHKDHMDAALVLEQFRVFRERTRGGFVVSDDPPLAPLRDGACVYGFGPDATLRATRLELTRGGSTFEIDGVRFTLEHPGVHNATNALAAAALAHVRGIGLDVSAAALARFGGVFRRFQRVGTVAGVEVVDDFAHNPEKVKAVLSAAQGRARRVFAWFQPHGFAPLRFFGDDLVETVAETLRPRDEFDFAPVYFAGGTVTRDVDSGAYVDKLRARGARTALAEDRASWARAVAQRVEPGDVVLVLGARDPTLHAFARDVVAALQARLSP